ncbi:MULTISPECIES: DUF2889 domain-containing protein [Protofrankia]|uniref:DUF2889 domain-containing protein n=1 Tax=Protofrankia TaxID=2994361 RepID=UPI0010410786|nr:MULTISPECIES: DUF2889 domain-containing protein [Protofrankia]
MTTTALQWLSPTGPTADTPPRLPGSVRRTSTVDVLCPDGTESPVVIVGRARDLRTIGERAETDSDARVVAEAGVQVTIDYFGDRTVTSIDCDPAVAGSDALLGARAGSGFRTALDRAVPELTAGGTLLGLLLDEVPVVMLISSSMIVRTAGVPFTDVRMPPVNVCAGWVAGGGLDVANREDPSALLGRGPNAPRLEDDSDPLGWHVAPPLPPGSIRRRRRIDVAPGPRPGEAVVDGLFRDIYHDLDGSEAIVHEYAVNATIDLATATINAAVATPRVLPGPQCPLAATSVNRVLGQRLPGLRSELRSSMTGPTTCTHLTDQLRALADIHALLPLLA